MDGFGDLRCGVHSRGASGCVGLALCPDSRSDPCSMIKTLCVVVLSLGLASCGCDSEAAGNCGDDSDCSDCSGCDLKDGQEGAQEAGDAVKDATQADGDKKDAMTPPPEDADVLPKKPDEGK